MDQSGRSYLNHNFVKTDDLKGWKQRIHEICEITYPNPSLEVTLTLIWKLYGSSAFIRENNTEDRLFSFVSIIVKIVWFDTGSSIFSQKPILKIAHFNTQKSTEKDRRVSGNLCFLVFRSIGFTYILVSPEKKTYILVPPEQKLTFWFLGTEKAYILVFWPVGSKTYILVPF